MDAPSSNTTTNVTTTATTTTTTTTTRTTRMIFVEEISDTERINETSESHAATPADKEDETEAEPCAGDDGKDVASDVEDAGQDADPTVEKPPDEEQTEEHIIDMGVSDDAPMETSDSDMSDRDVGKLPQADVDDKTEEVEEGKGRVTQLKVGPSSNGLLPISEESPRFKMAQSPRLAKLVPEVTRAERARQAFVGKSKRHKSHRALQNLDEMKTIQDTLMYETLRPLLFCMRISGIFFVRRKGTFGRSFREKMRASTALQIYCAVMCIVLLVNCVKSMFAFDGQEGFGSLLFSKFLTTIFAYESMSRAMLAYWGCARQKKGFAHIFLAMDRICYTDNIMPYELPMKKAMNYFICLSFVMSVANVATSAYGLFGDSQSRFESMLRPVPPDVPGILAFEIFLLLMVFINGMVAMFSLSFFTLICYCLYKEFEYFSRTFSLKIKEDGVFNDDLEKFRRNHQRRCKIVEDSDQSFKYYIANTYMTNVPLVCLLLYSIVYSATDDELPLSYQLINVFKLLYVFLQMIIVSIAATLINNQAHSPLVDMYNIRVSNFPADRQLEVNMFLNKLTGTEIGLTAWDMFVINKPAVLTVIGMILTYFFLLVQFRIPLRSPVECVCELWTNDSHIAELFNQDLFYSHMNLTFNETGTTSFANSSDVITPYVTSGIENVTSSLYYLMTLINVTTSTH